MNSVNKVSSFTYSQENQENQDLNIKRHSENNTLPKSQDDSKIVAEIEKTMQKLLNLNILESLSEDQDASSVDTMEQINSGG